MKQALAKLMEKDPVQSSTVAFRAGGNGVPILTRASGSSVNGYQHMGLPTGSKPSPGGGANKTTLGAYRMGESDGIAPPSAIYEGDIFGPIGQPGRVYPERTFANVGNNVFQPDNNDRGTLELLRKLGDQQFKAKSAKPFEDYRVQQRYISDLAQASRLASPSDSQLARDVIRNISAERRQQNENDYVRKMIDAGATPEFAQQEIQNVRNANALQEARKVDDRPYQAKTLIQRIAEKRGVTPMVREPLTQSSAITNPQPSQAMSQAMGKPGEGFGTSPLDTSRLSMSPELYARLSRRPESSQEASDEQTAFSNLLAQGEIPPPEAGSLSFATMQGQERQNQIELASEGLASRLESIRNRATRVYEPLPDVLVAKDVLDRLYKEKNKKPYQKALFSSETIQDMRALQLLIALNLRLSSDKQSVRTLLTELNSRSFGTVDRPNPNILEDLKTIVQKMNKNEGNISIPFASSAISISNPQLVTILQDMRTAGIRLVAENARKAMTQTLKQPDDMSDSQDMPESPVSPAGARGELPSMTARQAIAQAPVPGAPGPSATPYLDAIRRGFTRGRLTKNTAVLQPVPARLGARDNILDTMNKTGLIALLRANGLPGKMSEKREVLVGRLRSTGLVD